MLNNKCFVNAHMLFLHVKNKNVFCIYVSLYIYLNAYVRSLHNFKEKHYRAVLPVYGLNVVIN